MAVGTRKQQQAKKVASDAHTSYMQTYRTKEVVFKEAKLKILRRISKGSLPHPKSMAKYGISMKEINELRILSNLHAIEGVHIPYFMQAKGIDGNLGLNEADYLPDSSEIQRFNDDFDTDENEVTSSRRTVVDNADETAPIPAQTKNYGFSVGEISLWIQEFRGLANQKTSKLKSKVTIKNQFGAVSNKTGKFNNAGRFYNMVKMLGDKYIEDVRLAVKDDASVKYVIEQLNKPQFSLLKHKANQKKKPATIIQYLESLLLALRQYPGFDALNNRKYTRPYEQLNKAYVDMQTRESAEKLANPKEQQDVMEWNVLKAKVLKEFPSGTTKENLYIRMYDEFPSRDDFKNLFVDDVETHVYPNEQNYENVLKNTLYIRNNKNKASIVLVDYKTSGIYGKRLFHFSPELTKDIKTYVIKNKITAKQATRLLFGKAPMSAFVKNILDKIKVPTLREGQINYLRKSYISSAMKNFRGDAEARIQIAFHLKHSPSASLKYIREIQDKDPTMKEFNDLSIEKLTIGLAAEKTKGYKTA
jgi:hypothetical protein